MRNTIESLARPWRLALLGALMVLAAALPAGADPNLVYSTYLGGSGGERGIAVAAQGGNTFIVGTTNSLDYPVVGVSSRRYPSEFFVTALGPSGIPLYSTYLDIGSLNSDDSDQVLGIGVGPDGSAYVAVITYYRGTADSSVEIAKLAPSGERSWTQFAYGRIETRGMTVDSQGNVYVTGHDRSENPYPCCSSYRDEAFVWKIGADGSTSYWSTIDGNGFPDRGEDIAVDAAGNAYVLGTSASTNLPNAIQPVPGDWNAFVTKLDPAGSILWSTYLGGSGVDEGREIQVAEDGSLVVVGTTFSHDFPTLNAIQTGLGGLQDLFLARLKPWGSRISSTYLGGSGTEEVEALAVDTSSILLAVSSPGTDSPLREPLDPACGNVLNFAARLDAQASRVLDGVCLGGSRIYGVAADSTGVSLTGSSAAANLPLANAWQPSIAGANDAFATKLVLNHAPDCSAATANPGTLWPADGRFVSVLIRDLTDPEGDHITIALTSIYQDEWYTRSGEADASGLGASTARLRASRLNGGNGRVYHLGFTATDPRGGVCAGTVKVCVPPEQGGACVDGGARVDSTRIN